MSDVVIDLSALEHDLSAGTFYDDYDESTRLLGRLRDGIAELERLRAWKREANAVIEEWEKVHHALGEPGRLGESRAASTLDAIERIQWAYDALTSRYVTDNEHRLGVLGAQDLAVARRALVRLLPPREYKEKDHARRQ